MLYGSEAWCLKAKKTAISEENRESDDSSNVWCEAIKSKKHRGVDAHVGYKGVFG